MTVTNTATNERELLRELVNEHGIYSIASLLVDFVGELEDKATGEDKQRWAQCGQGFKRAKRYADEHWRETMGELRELDKLSTEVAEKVMAEPMPPVSSIPSDCRLITSAMPSSPLNAWWHVHHYDEGDECKWEPRPYAQSIAHAFQVEDRIAELGLQQEYVRALRWQLQSELTWNFVHASPEQRCRAALEAVKVKAKAASG